MLKSLTFRMLFYIRVFRLFCYICNLVVEFLFVNKLLKFKYLVSLTNPANFKITEEYLFSATGFSSLF